MGVVAAAEDEEAAESRPLNVAAVLAGAARLYGCAAAVAAAKVGAVEALMPASVPAAVVVAPHLQGPFPMMGHSLVLTNAAEKEKSESHHLNQTQTHICAAAASW